MKDIIFRQDAIAIADSYMSDESQDIRDQISLLPSAERHEKWIPEFNGKFRGGSYWFHCSHCKRIVPDIRNGGWNYCPSCGAKMDGKQNE